MTAAVDLPAWWFMVVAVIGLTVTAVYHILTRDRARREPQLGDPCVLCDCRSIYTSDDDWVHDEPDPVSWRCLKCGLRVRRITQLRRRQLDDQIRRQQ